MEKLKNTLFWWLILHKDVNTMLFYASCILLLKWSILVAFCYVEIQIFFKNYITSTTEKWTKQNVQKINEHSLAWNLHLAEDFIETINR